MRKGTFRMGSRSYFKAGQAVSRAIANRPRVIVLRYAGTCTACGASLPAGTEARWTGRGRVSCLGCEPAPAEGGKMVWVGGRRVRGSRCEDAPCCGCCGPGSDDPAYNEPSDPYDDR